MERLNIITTQLTSNSKRQIVSVQTAARNFPTGEDDVVVVSALRTPICKSNRGGLKDTLPDDLLSAVFTAVLKDSGVSAGSIQDICVGNVMQPGAGVVVSRMAQFFSRIPETVPVYSVNRMSCSGLQACMDIANSIEAGDIDIGIGAGVESLTLNPMYQEIEGFVVHPRILEVDLAKDLLVPISLTSDNLAEKFGVTREEIDTMAMQSHAKAAKAQREGLFDNEIVPVHTVLKDKDGNERQVVTTADDGVRADTSVEILAKLKPAFQDGGPTTAGNSGQVSDGAAAVILARRSYAQAHGLPILGSVRGFAVVGVPPNIMGIGSAEAIPAALKKAGLTIDDISIFEISEGFASQVCYSVKKLGIPMEKVNPKGGAIALGYPVGCTGAHKIVTLLHECKRRGKPCFGVVSMCIALGMGAAAVFEYEG